MVGAPAIDVEPHSQFLSSDTLLSPSGPRTNTTSDSFQIPLSVLPNTAPENPLIDCAPGNYCPVSDLSDMTDSELERMLSPFSTGSDANFDASYFDLESFMAV